MTRKSGEYVRLPGGRRGGPGSLLIVSRCSLWLGNDHLLSVLNTGYTESYNRFYYKDIQALTIRKTIEGMAINTVLAILSFTLALLYTLGSFRKWDPGALIATAVAAGITVFFLLVNWLMGPTCSCSLRTAVQTVPLYTLKRLRQARKAIRLISERVESVQGALSRDDMPERWARMVQASVEKQGETAQPPGASPAHSAKPFRTSAHWLLVAVLMLDVVHSIARFSVNGTAMFFAGVALLLGLVLAAVLVLITQAGASPGQLGLRRLTWWTMGYIVAGNVAGGIRSMFYALANPESAGNYWEFVQDTAQMSPFSSAWELYFTVFSIVCSGILSISGLILLIRFHRSRETAASRDATP